MLKPISWRLNSRLSHFNETIVLLCVGPTRLAVAGGLPRFTEDSLHSGNRGKNHAVWPTESGFGLGAGNDWNPQSTGIGATRRTKGRV